MRKLIVSLDGYVAGPGGNVMALPMDGFFDDHNLERLRAADTLLLGGTTYLGLKGYWPAVAEDPGVSPAVANHPEVAELHRETGQRNNEIHKVVVSDSLTTDDTAPWTKTTAIVRRAEAHRAVAELKDRPGKAILMFGSRTLWNDLLVAGYVRHEVDPSDRRRVIIHPLPEQLATIAPHYQGMATAWTDLLAAYSDEQLALFLELFDRMHQLSQQQLASLPHHTPSDA